MTLTNARSVERRNNAKIELSDREYWLTVVAERLQEIQEERDARDREFKANWRKRWLLPDRKHDEFPSNKDYWSYPSEYAYVDKYHLENIRRALLSNHTGTIYVDDEELRALGG